MSRFSVVALALGLGCFGALLLGAGRSAGQQSTPPSGTARSEREVLLQAAVRDLPDPPVVIRLRRVTLDPGAALSQVGPGLAFLIIEARSAAVAVSGQAVVLPANGAQAGESVTAPVDAEFALNAGDRIAISAGTGRDFRNVGEEETILLEVSVVAADQAPADDPVGGQGVTVESLGEGRADELPAEAAAVTLERFTLVAGTGVPAYPGPVMVAVEAGGFASTLQEGNVQLSRRGQPGTDSPVAPDEVLAVRPGDALFFPGGMEATPSLEGEGSVVLLRLGIVPVEAATPEAGASFQIGAIVVVTQPDVRLRAAPSLEGDVLAGLAQGQLLTVTGAPVEGSGLLWYPVADPNDPALSGYVAAEFLEAA